MNYIDIILAVLLIIGLVRGFSKGFFIEIASLASLILGLYGAIHFSYFVADWLKDRVSWNGQVMQVASFAITFFIILYGVSLVGKLITKMVNAASLGILNKLAGGVFGIAKIGLILSVVINMFSKVNDTISFVKKETLESSILYEPVRVFAPTIFPKIMDTVESLKEQNPFKKESEEENNESE
jgi:membrane protein required for colicin V production